jgi:ActR/RegA family two-component response regulator
MRALEVLNRTRRHRGTPHPGGSLVLDDVIEAHIRFVLWLCDNNLSEAARRLGMHRRSLQRYVVRLAKPRGKTGPKSKKARRRVK